MIFPIAVGIFSVQTFVVYDIIPLKNTEVFSYIATPIKKLAMKLQNENFLS